MALNYFEKQDGFTKEEKTVSLEEMREEVLAMMKVCFEGVVEPAGERIRIVLPEGKAFFVCVSET